MSFDDNNDPENELPDWLKDLQDDSGDPADSFSDPVEDEDKENQPRKLFSTENPQDSFEPASNKKASEYLQGEHEENEDDTQEWLKSVLEKQNPVLEIEQSEEPEKPSSLKDRIQKLKDKEKISSEEISEKLDPDKIKTPPLVFDDTITKNDDVDENMEVPDWLKSIQKGEPTTEDEIQESEDLNKTGSWIKKFTNTLDSSVLDSKLEYKFEEDLDWINEQVSSIADSKDIIDDLGSDPGSNPVPDWLTDMEDKSPENSEVILSEPAIPEIPIEEVETTDFTAQELESDNIPDWLKLSDSPIGAEHEEEHQKPEDTEISGDPLKFLAELRLSEGVDEEFEEEVEIFGPLMGIKNVLPAEPENILFSTNPHPRSDLFVSKTQKSHISILQSIVAEQKLSPVVEKKSKAFPKNVIRWLIAGLLYIAIIIPVFSNQRTIPIPNTAQPEITAMAKIINSLAPASPVLVAIEYQPGLSGEMEASSAAVLDHLLNQEAQLVFISTSPTGPGLTEHFLQNRLSNHSYIKDNKYPNLGYVSGGTAALLNFASNPRGTVPNVKMTDAEGNQIDGWKIEPLNQIQTINDFAMVLVITDDPTSAISWIEQVQPYLVDTDNTENQVPLTMVLSAQAEPLVYPYYDTEAKQVSAMISGLYGGVAYEALYHNENIASRYWDGFGNGLSLTISILLLGGSISLIQGWQKTRKKGR